VTRSHIDQLGAIFAATRIVDLSRTMETGMPAWPTQARYASVLYESYDQGDESVHSMVTFSEHSGTHLDAPMHFIKGGATIDELPPDRVIGRLVTIDASHLGPNEALPLGFVRQWESEHGEIVAGDIVCFRFGWDEKWDLLSRRQDFLKAWPGLSEEGARHLADRRVAAVGSDTASLDPADAEVSSCHLVLLGAGIPLIENVANLGELPPFSFGIGLPNKFKGGSGSPIRLLAIVEADRGGL